jgi:chemotaxis protein methyltransferase CheR
VEFCSGNLLDFSDDLPAGFNHLDLIICRNVFIYLNKEAIFKVMGKFARLLNEGGYLLTVHGELQGGGLSLKEFRAKIFPGSVIDQKTSAAASLADRELRPPELRPALPGSALTCKTSGPAMPSRVRPTILSRGKPNPDRFTLPDRIHSSSTI